VPDEIVTWGQRVYEWSPIQEPDQETEPSRRSDSRLFRQLTAGQNRKTMSWPSNTGQRFSLFGRSS